MNAETLRIDTNTRQTGNFVVTSTESIQLNVKGHSICELSYKMHLEVSTCPKKVWAHGTGDDQ